jgi:hypothetical protein
MIVQDSQEIGSINLSIPARGAKNSRCIYLIYNKLSKLALGGNCIDSSLGVLEPIYCVIYDEKRISDRKDLL